MLDKFNAALRVCVKIEYKLREPMKNTTLQSDSVSFRCMSNFGNSMNAEDAKLHPQL